MSKRAVISLSIIASIIVLIGVLFGAVFCLRTQKVTVLGSGTISVSKDDIITTAGFKKGQSIFMLDKDEAIAKIEAKYPYIKVIQIKTTKLTEIDIVIRARHNMCYTQHNNSYYIMDEEFKVLNIIEANSQGQESNEPTNLIHIEENILNINSSTLICDFVGTEKQKKVMTELYVAMTTAVTKTEDESEVYLTRTDICDILKSVEFKEFSTFDKVVVTTKYGVKLDIENPSYDLQNKINICFSTIKQFLSDPSTENKVTTGTIKIYYDLENNQKCIYVAQND